MAPRDEVRAEGSPERSASSTNGTEKPEGNNFDGRRRSSILSGRRASSAALLRNPLAGMTTEEILADVDTFVDERGLSDHREDFRKGALLAQVGNTQGAFEHIDAVSEEDKVVLRREETNKWDQPFMLYFLCTLCAGSAIVQGMDQTAVNGAQVFYYATFGLDDEDNPKPLLQGLLNGAPYLCSALIGCWTNPFLNKLGGRRFTIFISCFISVVTGFWMAAANS